MSRHEAKVIQIKEIKPHPNADSLGLVCIDGYVVCIKLGDFCIDDLAIYIEPDSIVPDAEEFAFLGDHKRIKVRKFRGIYSQGLLIPAPIGAQLGDDLMEQMGIEHYEPPVPISTGGEDAQAPEGYYPVYDVENFNKYPHIITKGMEVVITEKLHGTSGRYVWQNNQLHVGSRKNWKKYDPKNIWWRAVEQNPWIEGWCGDNQNLTLYGEVFGSVQSLKYGAKSGEIFFHVFDIWNGNRWLDVDEGNKATLFYGKQGDKIIVSGSVYRVPLLYRGPFDAQMARQLAEGDSSIDNAKHHREGVVIKPTTEQWSQEIGRVQLKIVGNRYLEKS